MDVYVLDQDLNTIGIIDTYKSVIWANRYAKLGDCELYLEASENNISLLQKNNYLARLDDDMVCQIKKIEIDTDVEDGNYLIVHGYDVKRFLDQRVVWNTMTNDGSVEDFARAMVQQTLCNPSLSARQLQKSDGSQLMFLGAAAGFSEVSTEQVSYKIVGAKIREYCETYKWGYKVVQGQGSLWFVLYKGTDRSNEVFFSNNYENLASTKYVDDETNLGNVALVGGAGEGAERARNVYGYAEGVDRYEIFVDAKDLARAITWEQLTAVYPTTDEGGQGYIDTEETSYVYKMNYINIQILDDDQLTQLETAYPDGQQITIDGNLYYQVYNEVIADLQTNQPEDNSPAILRDLVYSVYLLSRGEQAVSEYGEKVTFDGSIVPDVTFIYKKDYFLGDIVSVENEYGIQANARIVEVIEVNDENGYSVEPKFEYLQEV